MRKKRRKHWYAIFVGACPVCSRDHSYREIRYTKRPKLAKNRITYLSDAQTYD